MQDPGRGLQDAQHQTAARARRNSKPRPAGCAAPNRSPQDVQRQTASRRTRNTRPWPAGYAGPTRWNQRGVGECCTSRRCQVRGRRYGAGCCGREECPGALRVERRCISSLENERVKLSRGAATSRRPKGGNCGAATHPHCGPEATRRHGLKQVGLWPCAGAGTAGCGFSLLRLPCSSRPRDRLVLPVQFVQSCAAGLLPNAPKRRRAGGQEHRGGNRTKRGEGVEIA